MPSDRSEFQKVPIQVLGADPSDTRRVRASPTTVDANTQQREPPGRRGAPARTVPEVGPDAADLVGRICGPVLPATRLDVPTASLPRLSRATESELRRRLGLGETGARRLAAAFELGRRVEAARAGARPRIDGPAAAHRLLAPLARGLLRETFWALLLDARHTLLSCERVSEGTLTTSLVHPREVFGPALRAGAAAVLVAHNHPSGDPEPSPEDLEVTRRLARAGELLGVPLVDHLVLGQAAFVSLRDRGLVGKSS